MLDYARLISDYGFVRCSNAETPSDFTVVNHTVRLVCITDDAYVSTAPEACHCVGVRSACARSRRKCKAAK